MDATQNLLEYSQVNALSIDIVKDIMIELIQKHPDINKWEMDAFKIYALSSKVRAILCTLTNASYEDIVKVVHDKLNLNDLFDNRHKYLN